MARTAPTIPTAAPTPPIQRGDRATFSPRVDATITYLTGAPAEIYGLATNAYNNALDAFTSATTANAAKVDAQTARDTAQGYRDTTLGYRDTTLTYRDAAAASATAAQGYALALTATSTTSQTVGTGSKTFTTQAGKQFTVGQILYFVDPGNVDRWMAGPVTAYSGTSLSVNITDANPATSGQTSTSWNISIAGVKGVPGPVGGVLGGNLAGALNELAAASVASAASPDIWTPAGNYIPVTGTTTITSFPAAPQAGAKRTLLATAAFGMTASANLVIKGVQPGNTFTVAAGDEIDVRAETTTKFRVTVKRGDGTAMSALYGSFQNTLRIKTATTFTARRTGWHRITVIGGGGRGGIAMTSGASISPKATGGAGGGMAVGMRFLVAGTTYTALAGARLATATSAGSAAIQGAAGNASSFSGPNILTITANGGGAGAAAITVGSTAAGAVGGTATGGDINVQGGNSGSVTALADQMCAATGGGAVGLQGIGYSSGDISVTAASQIAYFATGGAGVGGNSASISLSTIGTNVVLTPGGGAYGPGTSAPGINYDGVAGGPAAPIQQGLYVLFNQTAGGGLAGATGGGVSANVDNGGGSGAAYAGNSGVCNYSCAGSGGLVRGLSYSSGSINDMPGGGSGGVADLSSGAATAGAPGVGMVQIEW